MRKHFLEKHPISNSEFRVFLCECVARICFETPCPGNKSGQFLPPFAPWNVGKRQMMRAEHGEGKKRKLELKSENVGVVRLLPGKGGGCKKKSESNIHRIFYISSARKTAAKGSPFPLRHWWNSPYVRTYFLFVWMGGSNSKSVISRVFPPAIMNFRPFANSQFPESNIFPSQKNCFGERASDFS